MKSVSSAFIATGCWPVNWGKSDPTGHGCFKLPRIFRTRRLEKQAWKADKKEFWTLIEQDIKNEGLKGRYAQAYRDLQAKDAKDNKAYISSLVKYRREKALEAEMLKANKGDVKKPREKEALLRQKWRPRQVRPPTWEGFQAATGMLVCLMSVLLSLRF
ncbi:YD repeat protein [Pseudomonas syringae pv. theae]|uniref:YD repeat protein n=1 Tax=Pseudomonas syringae pv. theae TaxID=103985 RepID=A0A3M5N434_PSESX|nr:hypothetical protein [Pseudomonas syringae pv. theae]RMT67110.1 YD repeat protein [Pseudomonas syringae pv. theae]